jgi:hypothetical protein
MTNSLNAARDIRTGKGGVANKAKMETLLLIGSTKNTGNRLVISAVVAVAIVVGIGITNPLFTTAAHHNTVTSKQCLQTPVKMFDQSNVPKYFIGSGYKITPVDPRATEVMIPICA